MGFLELIWDFASSGAKVLGQALSSRVGAATCDQGPMQDLFEGQWILERILEWILEWDLGVGSWSGIFE
jgi:hypothetical protein